MLLATLASLDWNEVLTRRGYTIVPLVFFKYIYSFAAHARARSATSWVVVVVVVVVCWLAVMR